MNTDVLERQLRSLAQDLSGSTILVSGATGLVGSAVVRCLLKLNDSFNAGARVLALVRDDEKAARVLGSARTDLSYVRYGKNGVILDNSQIDYVVHAAGISGGSKLHLKNPISVFDVGIDGTKQMLEHAVAHGCRGFCYVSTYEIYGEVDSSEPITEDHVCQLDPLVLRNSYAEVKRVCEAMLSAYEKQYGLKVYSGRLTSTFGTGVKRDDPRFFAEFARCVAESRDIILQSEGTTVRSYLDVDDAATAFLTLLAKGESGQAYNLSNRENVLSVREVAQAFSEASDGSTRLRFDITEDTKKLGFRSVCRTITDDSKLRSLGWSPVYSFEETVNKTIKTMRS